MMASGTAAGLIVLSLTGCAASDSATSASSASSASTNSASTSSPSASATAAKGGSPMPADSLPPLPPPVDLMATPDDAAVALALVGLTQAAAEAKAAAAGYTTRIAVVDGQPRPLTMDYSTSRINLTIDNGMVTGASVG